MAAERPVAFAEHVQELRKRLMWSLLFVAVGAGIGYSLHNELLIVLQRPLNESLYYTTPTGAFSFIIKVCTVFGLVVALPALLYHGFTFFEPLINARRRRAIVGYVVISVFLAVLGIAFAYFISLPAALNFLVNFGNEGGIESLITANEYFNFVLAYIAGFAVLFQLPLIIAFINRITPLTPSKLMGGTRYIVVASFIVAAIITPTPDPFNQALMAGPIILLYFISACVVGVINMRTRKQSTKALAPLPQIDPDAIAAVLATESATEPEQPESELAFTPAAKPTQPPVTGAPLRPRRPAVISDVVVPGRNVVIPMYQQRRPGQRIMQPSPRLRRPRGGIGLISDFTPAAE